MALRLPKRGIGGWAQEIISQCAASQKDRIQRGALLRNLYLTGSEEGTVQTYPKSNPYIENLSAYLYSPVELRFTIESSDQADEQAMAKAASQVIHRELRRGNPVGVDMNIDEAVLWSLIKGKTFLQLLWADNAFESYLVQPELMGVMREDLNTLDEQEAFFHSVWISRGRFGELIKDHEDEKLMLSRVRRYTDATRNEDSPDRQNMMKQVILGGLNPYTKAGSKEVTSQGISDWAGGPRPKFNPKVLDDLVRLDELWVRDAERDDWTTIQTVGDDCVIEGKYIHRNLFADPKDITDPAMLARSQKHNPLSGHHPFVEFCANTLNGYFWGRSELNNVGTLQLALNKRLDGIQSLLRRQENPPRVFVGSSSINQVAYAKLNKPGGYLAENSPNLKIETLAPELPADLWADLKQIEVMFDDMGGFTPTLQGRGESGVRAQGHADTLVRTASPRFKNRALRIERSVEAVGGLMLDVLRARLAEKIAGWLKPGSDSPSAAPEAWWSRFLRAPAKGMQRVEFLMYDLPPSCRVKVDSHSSSPAFSHEGKELAFALRKDGAIGAVDLIALTHPPHEEDLMLQAERREIEQAQFAAEHPEIALKGGKKK